MLNAQSVVALTHPVAVARRLCEIYDEFGSASLDGSRGRIDIAYGTVTLDVGRNRLRLAAEAKDETFLSYLKMGIAHHLLDSARPDEPALRWEGDGQAGSALPYFREMTVLGSRLIAPRMRRLTLKGENLARFADHGLHIRLLLPREGRVPSWPVTGEDGRPVWPGGDDALVARVYTLRRIDVERGEVEIDIVVHDGDDTPGANWAARARSGDLVGMTGPSGGGIPDARSLFLVGDETALPAIARILESLPPTATACVRIEVDGPADEQPMDSPAAVDLHWLHRRGAEPGTTGLLARAVAEADWSALGPDVFVWAGCEFSDFKAIRRFLRQEREIPKDRHLAVAYWRRGRAGDEARGNDA